MFGLKNLREKWFFYWIIETVYCFKNISLGVQTYPEDQRTWLWTTFKNSYQIVHIKKRLAILHFILHLFRMDIRQVYFLIAEIWNFRHFCQKIHGKLWGHDIINSLICIFISFCSRHVSLKITEIQNSYLPYFLSDLHQIFYCSVRICSLSLFHQRYALPLSYQPFSYIKIVQNAYIYFNNFIFILLPGAHVFCTLQLHCVGNKSIWIELNWMSWMCERDLLTFFVKFVNYFCSCKFLKHVVYLYIPWIRHSDQNTDQDKVMYNKMTVYNLIDKIVI